MTTTNDYAPQFDRMLLVHDGVLQDPQYRAALTRINGNHLLTKADSETLLFHTGNLAYTQLRQKNGTPYFEVEVDGKLKRHYVFVDPEYPDDPTSAVDVVCGVGLVQGRIVVLPEKIERGPNAFFIMAVGFECCEGSARTILYSDTKPDTGQAFLNTALSGGNVRSGIQQLWDRLAVRELDTGGQAALAHLIADMTGVCGHGFAGHMQRMDYKAQKNWQGPQISRFVCR